MRRGAVTQRGENLLSAGGYAWSRSPVAEHLVYAVAVLFVMVHGSSWRPPHGQAAA